MKRITLVISILFAMILTNAQTPLTEAVDFTGTDIHGHEITLSEILGSGQYVLIDFFFTSCGPCNDIAPFMQEAYTEFGCNSGDVFFLSVDLGDDNASCIEFDELHGIEFPCLSGIEGGGTAICESYEVPSYPTIILIAPNSSILIQDLWPISGTQTVIDALVAQGIEPSACQEGPGPNFSLNYLSNCEEAQVEFYNLTTGTFTGLIWTFEGGDPATSTEENPTVQYNSIGSFDVSLVATDETNTNEFLLEDAVTVSSTPEASFDLQDEICFDSDPLELSNGLPEGGIYSGLGVEDGVFSPLVAGLGNITITYTYEDEYECSASVDEIISVDNCTGIGITENQNISIVPNPASNYLSIKAVSSIKNVSIFNMLGQLIETTEETTINTSSYENGLYVFRIKTEEGNIIVKRVEIAH